ncbi:MAG: flagellar motor protein MotB [Acidobacteria bacterium]|nr:MAG: flagellar motor protein MotB [Acidobacteriota bacterium]
MKTLLLVTSLSLCSLTLAAQNAQSPVESTQQTPVYRVNAESRSIQAIDYRQHGSTKVDFKGTNLMPDASGEAKVESKAGRLEISADFRHVRDPKYYGPEYLTYVLWAITPQGRPVNLGELKPNEKHEVRIHVTANLQAFGMIVTAEPYFAVTRPSNVTVLQNEIREDTKGQVQLVSTRYDATEKGEYTVDLVSNQLPASTLTAEEAKKVPQTLLEARNAVTIAKATGAQQYAPDAMTHAEQLLARAESDFTHKKSRSSIETEARSATQAAEDARVLSIRNKADEQMASEQKATENRVAIAQEQAMNEREWAQSERERALEAQQAAQQAEQERRIAEQAKAQALQEQQQAEAARQVALAQKQVMAAQAMAAQAQAQTAQKRAQNAEQEKEHMRQLLLRQLNQVMKTRDSARGLIVNMSDVLFDVNQDTLKPQAKLGLAKVAGILQAYPDLKLQIEGYTDSTGSSEYNKRLSETRAAAVRDFLISQGVDVNSVTARGLGPANPVASNKTPEGRQLNRRVDLVVNGESIQVGRKENQAPASIAAPANPNPEKAAPPDTDQP